MYCPKCGKELSENSSFCSNCGLKIEKENPVVRNNPDLQNNVDPTMIKKKSKMSTKLLLSLTISIVIIVVAVVISVFVLLNHNATDDNLITAGAARVCEVYNDIYAIKTDGIYLFNDRESTSNEEKFSVIKKGEYLDICQFNNKIYTLKKVSENSVSLVYIDTKNNSETEVYIFDDTDSVYFVNRFSNKLYIKYDENIVCVDQNNNVNLTGYSSVEYLTPKGIYKHSKTDKYNNKLGLTFVTNDNKAINIQNTDDCSISCSFLYNSNLYVFNRNNVATEYVHNNSTIECKTPKEVIFNKNTVYITQNYYKNPNNTMLYATAESENETYKIKVYLFDVKNNQTELVYEKSGYLTPLAWVSIVDDYAFVGGISQDTEFIGRIVDGHIQN